MKPQNHPAKGSILSVEPIRNLKDIKTIKKRLDNPRDLALFVVGINAAFRASDLLKITVGQVRHLEPGEGIAKDKADGEYRGRIATARAKSAEVLELLEQGKTKNAVAAALGIGVASVYRIAKAARS